MRTASLLILLAFGTASAAEPELPVAARANLELNLRWILDRERAATKEERPKPAPRVGVWADAGVWHTGAKSIVEALEAEGIACRVLDKSRLTEEGLKGLVSIVLPGGWAPHQWGAAGKEGLAAIRAYVERGGRCVSICAGAYLLSKTVKYDGAEYPYPLGLFDGIAEGPVKGLKPYPEMGSARLKVTPAGEKRGLAALGKKECAYSGGPFFHKGTDTTVLATYPDGSAAVVLRTVGKGEILLIGAHPERSPDSKDDDPHPKGAGKILQALVLPERLK